jgi:hypothetical protein
MMYRMALPLMAFLVAGGCNGRDATGPMSPDVQPAVRLSAGPEAPVEVTFEKWFTTSPAMTGNTSYGDGTFAGTILNRTAFDNGVIVKLQARYIVTDPSGSHSFTALIQGTENLETATAVLNGVITEGWMIGAQVHVTFQIITTCALAIGPSVKNVCFQGTIRVQQG